MPALEGTLPAENQTRVALGAGQPDTSILGLRNEYGSPFRITTIAQATA